MTPPTPPQVDCDRHHASFSVPDVAAAVEFYTSRLGFRPGFTWGTPPAIAGMNLGSVQMFLERGDPNPNGCAAYFVIGNVDELHAFQKDQGVEVVEAPEDRHYGLRDYRVRDLHGYLLGFGQYIYNTGPPLPIERVALTVRLEKRLAALLQDLAAHKRMTVHSCLEETLLHTLDGVGPHTPSDLRHIEKLKQKHGIDYDSHASYRFVET